MKVLHFSDLHGSHMESATVLITQHQPEWIVLTGDMVPDFYLVGGRWNRLQCQVSWWGQFKNQFFRAGSTTTFTYGNHEIEGFLDADTAEAPPELKGKVGVLVGNPIEFGAWGFAREYEPHELQIEADSLNHPKVVLSHCPPFGWLDRTFAGESIGHRPLRAFLEDALDPPILVLCGHVHHSFGEVRKGPTLIVNSATGYSVIDLDLRQGTASVLEQAQFDSIHTGGAI